MNKILRFGCISKVWRQSLVQKLVKIVCLGILNHVVNLELGLWEGILGFMLNLNIVCRCFSIYFNLSSTHSFCSLFLLRNLCPIKRWQTAHNWLLSRDNILHQSPWHSSVVYTLYIPPPVWSACYVHKTWLGGQVNLVLEYWPVYQQSVNREDQRLITGYTHT